MHVNCCSLIYKNMKLRVVFILLSLLVGINILSGQKAPKKITLSGIAVDENNHPVTDAFVMIDGKLTSNTTDLKGFYKVKVLPSANKIGIYTLLSGGHEELINGRTTINFTLALSGSKKEDQSQKPTTDEKNDKASPANNDKKENKSFGNYKNIYELIQGELPTVIVQGQTVRIPGAVSLKMSTEPLFVVDGVQVNSISDINPSSVKSIEVIKGAAASIYGMKGANGVILINLLGSKNNDYKQ